MLTKEIMSNFATDRLSIALRVYSQKCLTLKYNGLRNRNKEQGMPKEKRFLENPLPRMNHRGLHALIFINYVHFRFDF